MSEHNLKKTLIENEQKIFWYMNPSFLVEMIGYQEKLLFGRWQKVNESKTKAWTTLRPIAKLIIKS